MLPAMKKRSARRETARERFARNLKSRRLELELSQEQLAEGCGLHRTYVGSVERAERNVSIDNMERLALAVGLSLVDLLSSER